MRFILAILVTLSTLSTAYADAPAAIPVKCGFKNHSEIKLILTKCGNHINNEKYGPYWCEGPIDGNYSVKVEGYLGTGSSTIRLTYLPGKFTGTSPIEVNGEAISCLLNY